MRIARLLLFAVLWDGRVAAATEGPRHGLCAYETRTSLRECGFKNDACLERQAQRSHVQPRFRINNGPWVAFPQKGWRCVELPLDRKLRVTLENFGQPIRSWDLRWDGCDSGVLDLNQNTYASHWSECTPRKKRQNEEWVPYLLPPSTP